MWNQCLIVVWSLLITDSLNNYIRITNDMIYYHSYIIENCFFHDIDSICTVPKFGYVGFVPTPCLISFFAWTSHWEQTSATAEGCSHATPATADRFWVLLRQGRDMMTPSHRVWFVSGNSRDSQWSCQWWGGWPWWSSPCVRFPNLPRDSTLLSINFTLTIEYWWLEKYIEILICL